MRIHAMSDLHFEFAKADFEMPKGEILVLAGDIFSAKCLDPMRTDKDSRNYRDYIHSFFDELKDKFAHVIYVTGNHEYYRSSMKEVHCLLGNYLPSHIKWLNGTTFEYDGWMFTGATLWTEMLNPTNEIACYHGMNDYRMIELKRRSTLTTAHTKLLHRQHLHAIKKVCAEHGNKTIVVTHHTPSYLCLNDSLHNTPLDDAYYSNLHGFIGDYKPKLWFCGHTHVQKEFDIFDTHIFMNCRGYGSNQRYSSQEKCSLLFNPDCYIDV